MMVTVITTLQDNTTIQNNNINNELGPFCEDTLAAIVIYMYIYHRNIEKNMESFDNPVLRACRTCEYAYHYSQSERC